MTLGEVLSRIQSEYSKGVPSQSVRLSDRMIYSVLTPIRSKLLTQAVDKRQRLSEWDYQTLPCIEVTPSDLSDCPSCVPTGCSIYKSLQPFPAIIASSMRDVVKSVTSVDGYKNFDPTEWNHFRVKAFEKYTSKSKEYFFHNGYLWVLDDKVSTGLNKRITVVAAFNDPVEVWEYPQCDSSCVDIFDKFYPLNGKFLDAAITLTVEQLKRMFILAQEERTLDLKEN